ncbi:response regulator [Sediminimonas sp.]|uniref:response regulator n=1 Tax=Sediminimonas sp. TaxID=2823379 RepID=UPI0025DB420C|nr:response regulator [Sediminimonas sp.]
MPDSTKLLVVDDDHMMLEFTERAVISLGYSCVTAEDAASALRRLEEDRDIRILIIDMRLGKGPTGTQLAHQALAIRPGIGVILTSGDPGSLKIAAQEMPQDVGLLPKPYRRRDLADRLASIL